LAEQLKARCVERELPAVFSHLYRQKGQSSAKEGKELSARFERERERIATKAATLLKIYQEQMKGQREEIVKLQK
jgi:hypothetical protein